MATDELSQAIREGMEHARKQGRPLGRPSKITGKVASTIDRLAAQGATISAIASACGLSESTVRRYLRQRL